jgi:hypothetical protein
LGLETTESFDILLSLWPSAPTTITQTLVSRFLLKVSEKDVLVERESSDGSLNLENKLESLSPVAYAPDLAPCHSYLFPEQTKFEEERFETQKGAW